MAATYAEEVMADGPIGYWNFNNSNYQDASGSNLHGTAVGAVAADQGGIGGALGMSLTCNGGRVQIGNQAALQLATLTLEAWIYTDKNDSAYQSVVYKDSAYQMFVRNGHFICHDRGSDRDSGVQVAGNGGHHIALAMRVPPTLSTMYVDGVAVADVTMGVFNQTQALAIGAQYGTGGSPLIGRIDDVAIYNKILSPARIARHYQVGWLQTGNGMVNAWHDDFWDQRAMKSYNGSGWVDREVNLYNGTEWILTK